MTKENNHDIKIDKYKEKVINHKIQDKEIEIHYHVLSEYNKLLDDIADEKFSLNRKLLELEKDKTKIIENYNLFLAYEEDKNYHLKIIDNMKRDLDKLNFKHEFKKKELLKNEISEIENKY